MYPFIVNTTRFREELGEYHSNRYLKTLELVQLSLKVKS